MTIIRIFAALCVAVLLGACATTQPPEPIRTRTIFVEPPAALVQNCPITAPPGKEEYLKATPRDRDQMGDDYIRKLQSDLKNCNKDKKDLRDWTKANRDIYTKDNPK
jgi:hypothetical protein